MAIIYSYPRLSNPTSDDLLIVTDVTDNSTKTISIGEIPFDPGVTGISTSSTVPAFTLTTTGPSATPNITLASVGGVDGQFLDYTGNWSTPPDASPGGGNNDVQFNQLVNNQNVLSGDSSFKFYPINNGTEGQDPNSIPKAHEIILGAAGGGLPGMLTLFGDDDPRSTQGTSGILRYTLSTGIDYVTLTGPDIQTELTITSGGADYVITPSNQPTGVALTGGNGSGLRIFIVEVDENTGAIEKISIAQQGGNYQVGDILTLPEEGDGNAEFRVAAAREGGNEILQYDIKLPKYKPFDDKIWFGKGTGKYGELTTNEYFKIKLVDFDPGQGHNPGGRLQLTIGSDNLTNTEPYGSILLNGGDNVHESGVIRLANVYNTQVGIMGPKGVNPSGPANSYDFMLPYLPPEQPSRMFMDGVSTASVTTPGSNQGIITAFRVTTTNQSGSGAGCLVDVVAANGVVQSITIADPGDGYTVDDVLKINSHNVPDADKAEITVTALTGNESKLLVVSGYGTNTASGIARETRWVDFPLPRLNHGFSPFPIYQGSNTIAVTSGSSLAIAGQTICDIAAGQLTITRVFGNLPEGCIIKVAVYSGSLTFPNSTKLVYFGTETVDATTAVNDIHTIDAPFGEANNWIPVAGTPITTVIEIDNSSGQTNAQLLGTLGAASLPQVFQTRLAFEVAPVDPETSIFDAAGTGNTVLGSSIQTIGNYGGRSVTSKRVCQHFDPA